MRTPVPARRRGGMEALHVTGSGIGILPVGPDRLEACPTTPFMVPMHAQKRKEAFHEPGSGPVGRDVPIAPSQSAAQVQPCAGAMRTSRPTGFMVPMRGGDTVEALDKPRGGFTLIECLVYIGVLMVIVGLALAGFYRIQKQTRNLGKNAADIVRAVQAGERWRDDIRHATGAPQWNSALPHPELRIPHASGDIAYAFRENTVWRRDGPGHTWEAWLAQVKDSHMVEDKRRGVTAWRWDIELQENQKIARVRPLFSFLAVLPAQQPP